MLIDMDLSMAMLVFLLLFLLFIASVLIPIYGYRFKRWKGLAVGCLVQPFVYVIVSVALFFSIITYEMHILSRTRKAAMVTVRSFETTQDGKIEQTWYLKPDEECFMEYLPDSISGNKSKKDAGEDEDKDEDNYREGNRKYYDIIRLDSTSVCVEDRIVVRFDLKNQKATATDWDEPTEILNIDWDKVKTYFSK